MQGYYRKYGTKKKVHTRLQKGKGGSFTYHTGVSCNTLVRTTCNIWKKYTRSLQTLNFNLLHKFGNRYSFFLVWRMSIQQTDMDFMCAKIFFQQIHPILATQPTTSCIHTRQEQYMNFELGDLYWIFFTREIWCCNSNKTYYQNECHLCQVATASYNTWICVISWSFSSYPRVSYQLYIQRSLASQTCHVFNCYFM